MTRPRYESPDDRRREREFYERFNGVWDTHKIAKLPDNAFADFAVCRANRVCVGVMEFKCRSFRWGAYPTVMISLLKAREVINIADAVGGRAWFAVQDSAGDVRIATLSAPFERVEYGGRTRKTRDAQDIELVAHIRTIDFVPFDEWSPDGSLFASSRHG